MNAKVSLSRVVAGASALVVGAIVPVAASAQPVQITLWHQEEVQSRIKQFQTVIDEFNASQNKYKVVQQVQSWNNIYQKLPPAVQAGVQPDIQFTIPDFTITVRKTGVVQPVTDFVDKLDKTHQFLKQAVVPYTDDGQVWAVPLYGMVQVLWYRKDMFKAAGLDPQKPPATWDEMLADAKKLSKDSVYGVGVPASHSLATDQVFYSFMATNGGKELFDAKGNVTFDTPNNVETLKFYQKLAEASPSGIASWTWAEPSNGAMIMTKDPEHIAGAEAFLSFVLEPKHYAPFLLAEPGLFLPLTEDGAKSGWQDADALKPYQTCVNLMIEESKYGVLPGFNTGKVQPAIGPIMAQNLLSQVIQHAVVGKEDAKAAIAWGQRQMESAVGQ